MPKLSGLFDSFDNLDQIPVENIAYWIKPAPNLIQLENYIANKILYPGSVPISKIDMAADLAILREALKLHSPGLAGAKKEALLGSNPFLNITLRKILIPQSFLDFTLDLSGLTWAFVDALLLNRSKEDWFGDLWTVVLTGDSDLVAGSVLLPQFNDRSDLLEFSVSGKMYKISPGSLTVVACPKERCQISFNMKKGKVLGKNAQTLEIYGGTLGIMIDGRNL